MRAIVVGKTYNTLLPLMRVFCLNTEYGARKFVIDAISLVNTEYKYYNKYNAHGEYRVGRIIPIDTRNMFCAQ